MCWLGMPGSRSEVGDGDFCSGSDGSVVGDGAVVSTQLLSLVRCLCWTPGMLTHLAAT